MCIDSAAWSVLNLLIPCFCQDTVAYTPLSLKPLFALAFTSKFSYTTATPLGCYPIFIQAGSIPGGSTTRFWSIWESVFL